MHGKYEETVEEIGKASPVSISGQTDPIQYVQGGKQRAAGPLLSF
jgi:hypothetical protein